SGVDVTVPEIVLVLPPSTMTRVAAVNVIARLVLTPGPTNSSPPAVALPTARIRVLAALPRLESAVIPRNPWDKVTLPAKVEPLASVTVPAPTFVSARLPLIGPLRARVAC